MFIGETYFQGKKIKEPKPKSSRMLFFWMLSEFHWSLEDLSKGASSHITTEKITQKRKSKLIKCWDITWLTCSSPRATFRLAWSEVHNLLGSLWMLASDVREYCACTPRAKEVRGWGSFIVHIMYSGWRQDGDSHKPSFPGENVGCNHVYVFIYADKRCSIQKLSRAGTCLLDGILLDQGDFDRCKQHCSGTRSRRHFIDKTAVLALLAWVSEAGQGVEDMLWKRSELLASGSSASLRPINRTHHRSNTPRRPIQPH